MPCPAPPLRRGRFVAGLCLLSVLVACGGGGGGDPPAGAPVATPPLGTPVPAIDSGAAGDAVDLRLARGAQGDAVVVWRSRTGTRHQLWANRYDAAGAAWGRAVRVDAAGTDIDDFDLAVDAAGGAVLVWHEARVDGAPSGVGHVVSARLAPGGSAWSAPELVCANALQPRVASNAAGRALVVYVAASLLVRGRFLDPATGRWQAEDEIELNRSGTGFSTDPVAGVEDSGAALAAFANQRTGASVLASNDYAPGAGGWRQLTPEDPDFIGTVPGSFELGESHHLELAATGDGGFLLAWESAPLSPPPEVVGIRIARYAGPTAGWTRAQTLVPGDERRNARLQRLVGNAAGRTWLLWTEDQGARTALLAWPLDAEGAVCGAVQVVDAAVGGGAAQADLAVGPGGQAVAVWQQFEGGRADDGSRSNIAFDRFDVRAPGAARLAEAWPGAASRPRVGIAAGQALLGWVQQDGDRGRVKAGWLPVP